MAKGLGIAGAGLATSLLLAPKAFKMLPRFKTVGLLSSIFAGEAMLAEGLDKSIESRNFDHRTEQNIKNVAGGLVGVVGAVAGMKLLKKSNFIKFRKKTKPIKSFLKKNKSAMLDLSGLGLLASSEFIKDKDTKKSMDVTGLGLLAAGVTLGLKR